MSSLPATAQHSISSAVGRDDSRYWVAERKGEFHAGNPEHALTMDFTSKGVDVRSGTARWRIALSGYGYGDAVLSPGSAAPHSDANRVEYRRGPLTEWYLNGPSGIEQGFTLAEPPQEANGQPLTIGFALSGDFLATLDPGATALQLTRPGGPSLRYTGLTAYDDTGRELRAWLELQGNRELLLRVDDTGARYPLMIDPWVQQAKLTASDGAPADKFGRAIAISGDTVVVGAYNAQIGANAGQGAAYVFVKPSAGWATTSTFAAKLTASDGVANTAYADHVAIDGDTVVVGANTTIGANPSQGAAYVYVKPATGWATTSAFDARLTPAGGAAAAFLGHSVGISGDTVVLGAGAVQVGANLVQGAAYVFVKPATGWLTTSTYDAQLTASDGAANDFFGDSVAINGDTVVATAPSAQIGANPLQGAAYVFVKPATGWTTTSLFDAKLTASDGAAGDTFGGLGKPFPKAAISADTVVIGVPNAKIGANSTQGAAYVYVKPATGWATTSAFNAKLTASDGLAGDLFANTVSLDGDTVVAGSSVFAPGSAYVFVKPATGWTTTSTFDAKLGASDGTPGDAFGVCSISGDTIAVGAQFAGPNLQGAAYVFGFFVPYATFAVEIDTQGGVAGKFAALGRFKLGAASNGINPATEPLALQVGPFSATIPAGSLKRRKDGSFLFAGTINGAILEIGIIPLGNNSFLIEAVGLKVDLIGLSNPVIVGLTIGNDGGTTTAIGIR
jgi:hypothetical protein